MVAGVEQHDGQLTGARFQEDPRAVRQARVRLLEQVEAHAERPQPREPMRERPRGVSRHPEEPDREREREREEHRGRHQQPPVGVMSGHRDEQRRDQPDRVRPVARGRVDHDGRHHDGHRHALLLERLTVRTVPLRPAEGSA